MTVDKLNQFFVSFNFPISHCMHTIQQVQKKKRHNNKKMMTQNLKYPTK